ncbi:MAG: hypothetical protein ACP5SI_09070 [Chloroflexia bacterium]
MARKAVLYRDPWLDLLAVRGNRQVDLKEVFVRLSVGPEAREHMKRALLERIAQLSQDRLRRARLSRH